MNLWILSALEGSPTDARLRSEAVDRGHTVRLTRPSEVAATVMRSGRSAPLKLPDGVLTRTGASAPPDALDALRFLEEAGVPCVNGSAGMRVARDKWQTYLALSAAEVPVPPTVLVEGGELPGDWSACLGNPPWYGKPAVGTQGIGVERIDSMDALRRWGREPGEEGTRRILQTAVVGSEPGDLRLLVIDGEVAGSMRRAPAAGEHRANLHRGGSARPVVPSEVSIACATAAARALGLAVAGVDLIETAAGPRVLEVNGASGLVGLESAEKRNLAGRVVAALERRLDRRGG